LGTLILIQKPEVFTVRPAVGNFSSVCATQRVVLFAGMAIVPPLLVFASLQRSFTDGLTRRRVPILIHAEPTARDEVLRAKPTA
jgi:ABC-type glycerol-3-phosphate transport system permease component